MSLTTSNPDPSGSHKGSDTPSGTCDTFRASPPAIGSTQICAPLSRVETNASVFPSGDQRGWRSEPAPPVSCRDLPVATSTTHTRETLRLSWSDGVDTVYATHLPSGESCGSLTAFSARKSSKLMARFCAATNVGMTESWNVSAINRQSRVIPTFQHSIVPPQYSGCVRMALTRSSKI